MNSPSHDTPLTVEIDRGTVAQVGGSRVAVSALTATPPPVQGAMPGARATVVIASERADLHVETTLVVHEHHVLPLADGLHRVERITPPTGANGRGQVTVATAASTTAAARTLFLGEGGKLRLGGPSVDAAFDVRLLKVEPDNHTPATVTVEWLPAAFSREDTPPAQIKQQRLKRGDTLQVGTKRLTVTAIEGESLDHPCWVALAAD